MSELSPLTGVMRKSHFRAAKTVFDPDRTCDRLDLSRKIAYARPESIGGTTGNAAARVDYASRRHGGDVAACSACWFAGDSNEYVAYFGIRS
jgi:hypothetical protein